MRKSNQQGFGLIEVLLVVFILAIIAVVSIPAFTGPDAPVESATVDGAALNIALVESAAGLAYMSESGALKKEMYTLGELVIMGYLNAELTREQELGLVTHTGNGNFTYTPND